MRIKIILSNKSGPDWAEHSNPGSFKAHIKFKGSLSNPTHFYLSPAQPLSGPLNTLDVSNQINQKLKLWLQDVLFTLLHPSH